MAQTYVSAALGSMVSQIAMSGIKGANGKFNFEGAVIPSMMTGTAFIAYPVACHILKNKCPAFKKNFEDPKGNKAMVYIEGGALGAAIVTAMNYPLKVIQEGKCKDGKKCCAFSPKKVLGFYVDQIGSSIGFAATMGTVSPLVPVPKNSLLAYARNHALIHVANIGGKILATPAHYLRHGTKLSGMVGGYVKGALGVDITGDATAHFKNVLGFMIQ
mgnify:FL=1